MTSDWPQVQPRLRTAHLHHLLLYLLIHLATCAQCCQVFITIMNSDIGFGKYPVVHNI